MKSTYNIMFSLDHNYSILHVLDGSPYIIAKGPGNNSHNPEVSHVDAQSPVHSSHLLPNNIILQSPAVR